MHTPPPVPPPFPYDDLPPKLVRAIDGHNKAARMVTIGTAVSLFALITAPVVILYGLVKFLEATSLTMKHPEIRNPKAQFPGKTKLELKRLSIEHPNLARLMEFSQARMGFWIASLFLTLYLGFNPNYRELDAWFALHDIGLTDDIEYMIRELHPQAGRWIGRPGGDLWRLGKQRKLPIKGPAALVLEVLPASEVKLPALIGATGKISVDGKRVVLTEVRGETGRTTELALWLPGHPKIDKISVNGREFPAPPPRSAGLWQRVPVTFAGEQIDHCPQVGAYDPDFADRVFSADLTVPQQVFDQLAARRKAWPVDYTEEELLATWRGSDRLLLFIQIAEPDDTWQLGLKIDGRRVEVKKAYSDVFPLGRERTFTGFYADLSNLQPDTPHQVEVELPPGLQPGQFQGLFLENVAAQFTDELAE